MDRPRSTEAVRPLAHRTLPFALLAGLVLTMPALAARTRPTTVEDLARLSLEELATVEVTSVSRRPEPLAQAPAAVYVITDDDIRRSGARSLPEILRLAPNLHVARLNAVDYAISARGFNSTQASNKLLVLIDGREVYTALLGGVFWQEHQLVPEDIERIEVISGPGGTLWGANAVNGVINVVTKNAGATRGGRAAGTAGTVESDGSLRYGGALGQTGAYRIYGMHFRRGESVVAATGRGSDDDWEGRQAGFRTDWETGASGFTVQGDIYEHTSPGSELSGGNLIGRWVMQMQGGSTLQVQGYYDASERLAPGLTSAEEVFDVEAQHALRIDRHEVVWGGGYRVSDDRFVSTLNPFVLTPESDTIQFFNVFAQDTVALADDLSLTVGLKLEHSTYSGLEYLPNARLGWSASATSFFWGAVSRAVRTPTRIDRELNFPGLVDAATDFESEEVLAYELGWRGQPTGDTSLSVSLFYNDYEELRALATSDGDGLFVLSNVLEGDTWGVEAWGEWRPFDWWRLRAGLRTLEKDLTLEPSGLPLATSQHAGIDPEWQAQLRSSVDVAPEVELDVGLRASDDSDNQPIPGFVEMDARLGWRVVDGLTLSFGGSSLLDRQHPETGEVPNVREIRRMVYLGAEVTF